MATTTHIKVAIRFSCHWMCFLTRPQKLKRRAGAGG
jgi:hypothetical protein